MIDLIDSIYSVYITGLFIKYGGAEVSKISEGVLAEAQSDNRVTFSNAISTIYGEIYLLQTDDSNYKYIEITLTDGVFGDSVSFRVYIDKTLADNFCIQDRNGSYNTFAYYVSNKLVEKERLHYFYDNDTRSVYNANHVRVAGFRFTTDGRTFNGFESGSMRVSVKIGGILGPSSVCIAKLGNQSFDNNTLQYGDIMPPQLSVIQDIINKEVPLNYVLKIPTAAALGCYSVNTFDRSYIYKSQKCLYSGNRGLFGCKENMCLI